MDTTAYIQDYYGKKNVITKSKTKSTLIFVIDDSKLYRSILRGTLKRRGYQVYSFSSGEEALDYMGLDPVIVIIDYHLDGVNPYNNKADVICNKIKQTNPRTKIIVITSDKKFKTSKPLMYANSLIIKDSNTFQALSDNISFLEYDVNYLKSQSIRYRILNTIRFIILLFLTAITLMAIIEVIR